MGNKQKNCKSVSTLSVIMLILNPLTSMIQRRNGQKMEKQTQLYIVLKDATQKYENGSYIKDKQMGKEKTFKQKLKENCWSSFYLVDFHCFKTLKFWKNGLTPQKMYIPPQKMYIPQLHPKLSHNLPLSK